MSSDQYLLISAGTELNEAWILLLQEFAAWEGRETVRRREMVVMRRGDGPRRKISQHKDDRIGEKPQ